MKGQCQIEQDMFNALQPFMKDKISGDTYLIDTRPFNSQKEDCIVKLNSATGDQVQQGLARIAIYTQDIDNGTGHYLANRRRLQELELLADDIVSLLNDADTSYLWGISSSVPLIIPEPQTKEHALNINLNFKLTNY